MSYSPPSSTRVEEALSHRAGATNGFRAIAVLVLVIGHSSIAWVPAIGAVQTQVVIGFSIVALFVITGFTLTWGLTQEFDQRGTIMIRRFFARKAVRVFPTLAAFTLVTSVHHLANGTEVPLLRIASLIGLMVNYYNALALSDLARHPVGHLWSIAVGAHFVLIWPMVLLVALRRGQEKRLATFLGVIITASALLRVVIYPWFTDVSPMYLYNATETRLGELSVGALGAILLRIERSRRTLDRVLEVRWLPEVTLLALVISLAQGGDFANGPGHTVYAFLSLLLLLQMLSQRERAMPRLLSTRPLTFISTISFSLFVWHLYGVGLPPLARLPAAAQVVVSVGVILACGSVAHVMLERPFRRLGDSLR